MNSNKEILLHKLDEFIRKYYKNQLIKGAILSTGTIIAFYLTIAILEYFSHFNTTTRTILFYLFIISNIYILTKLVIIPVFRLNKMGKIISYEEAALIIGKHFSEVKDKLINILQLQQQENTPENIHHDLLKASIEQKIKELKPVPFTSAIDLSENKKHLKYAVIPLSIFILIVFAAPSLITESTKRLVKHNTYFEKQAPFSFEIKNKKLEAMQQDDFTLEVKLSGNEIPSAVFLETEGVEYRLEKNNIINFSHIFKNIQGDIRFRLIADGFTSKEYELKTIPKPVLVDFEVALTYPSYIGKKNESLKNIGDIIIPAGTKVYWKFNTQNTDLVKINFTDTVFSLTPSQKNTFDVSKHFFGNKVYSITTANNLIRNKDSIVYNINVIPDNYPAIQLKEDRDSTSLKRVFFSGNIKDDYGFAKLAFHYRHTPASVTTTNTQTADYKSVIIPVNKKTTHDQFYHFWDMNELGIGAGDEVEYYFEVWDNDGVHGSKATRTEKIVFKAPTLNEIAQNTEKSNEEIKEKIEESIKEAKELQKQINDINKKVLEKKKLDWEEKKKLEDLLNKQRNLQKNIENIKKENSQNNREQNEYKQADENLLEKQQQLEELFKEIMTDEMKKLFAELEKLLNQLDKEKVQETLEQMKLSNKDIEKELDRTLELFKQMEFEQKLEQTIEKLDELAKKQEQLSEKTNEKNADNKQLEEKQQELNKEFENIQKDLDNLEKKNNELEQPNKMDNTEKQEQDVKNEMQNSSEQLSKNNKKKAGQSQKNAAQKMQELKEQMQQMQSSMQMESSEEDMNKLRDILENLVKLSFDQEKLMTDLTATKTNNPQYVKLAQQQKKLQDDSKMIEDSILALSKRVPEIKSMVNREISAINMNMGKAIEAMAERQTSEAAGRQQMAMTSVNNLALLLNEALQQMQAQMRQQQSQMQGNGSCNKPGGSGKKPSAANMRQMQEQLNKQIESLKKQMEQGQKDGKNKGQQGKGGMGMSEELAKLAAQQEAIRREMQKMMEEMKKEGNTPGGNLKELQNKMEETETDLVNKMITQETIRRQQEILTRLLEHEKAERERDTDEKRESKEAKNENFRNPNDFLEYKRLKEKEMELLKTIPAALNPFYKTKVNEYFNTFE